MSCATGDCNSQKTLFPYVEKPTTLCSSEVYKQFKDAVVSMTAIPKFTIPIPNLTTLMNITSTAGSPPFPVPSTVDPVRYANPLPVAPMVYSGFRYEKNGYIVSTSSFLYAFVLALMYYQLSQPSGAPVAPAVGALPSIVEVVALIFNPCIDQSLSDFFDFFVTVYNVNGCGRSYVYRAYVAGVDFDTGIAIYAIDGCDPWNKCSVPIKQHSFLMLGNSKCYMPGNPVHIIGSQTQHAPLCMASGTVVSNNDPITNGTVTYEAILTDVSIMNGMEGAPILDQCGFVVGIVTGRTGFSNTTNSQNAQLTAHAIALSSSQLTTTGAPLNNTTGTTGTIGTNSTTTIQPTLSNRLLNVASVSQRGSAFGVTSGFIGCVVDRLIENHRRPECSDFVIYNDIYGFPLYRHATLGISYNYRTGAEIGLYGLNSVYPCDMARWYDQAYCQINRELIGIVVKTVCGAIADAYEDCRVQQFPIFSGKTIVTAGSDFFGFQVQQFDVITGLNGLRIGQLPSQITPETLFYNLCPCSTITVDFLKACEAYSECHTLCSATDDSLAFLFNFPDASQLLPGVIPAPTQSVINSTMLNVLVWFFNSLSQVDRAYLLSLIFQGQFGFSPDVVALFYPNDPNGLMALPNSPTLVPAFDFNINYLSSVITNNCCQGYLTSVLNIDTVPFYTPPTGIIG